MRVKICEEWLGCGGPQAAGEVVQVESSWEGGDRQKDMEKCAESKHTYTWGDGKTVTETQRTEPEDKDTEYTGDCVRRKIEHV